MVRLLLFKVVTPSVALLLLFVVVNPSVTMVIVAVSTSLLLPSARYCPLCGYLYLVFGCRSVSCCERCRNSYVCTYVLIVLDKALALLFQ